MRIGEEYLKRCDPRADAGEAEFCASLMQLTRSTPALARPRTLAPLVRAASIYAEKSLVAGNG
jgi:hypothetical protein